MIELSSNPRLLAAPDGTPHERLGGIETEYGYLSDAIQFAGAVALDAAKEQGKLYVPPGRLMVLARHRTNYFDEEAYRQYIDVHDHPERCTPEHTNYRAMAYSVLHGHVLTARIFREGSERLKEAHSINAGAIVLANNSDSDGHAWGTHPNLIMRRELELKDYEDALVAHYCSRIVWSGSGAPVKTLDGKYQYGLSARADHIYGTSGTSTMENRPFINTRDEPHADKDRFRRLHGIHGESVFSPQVLAALMGTESLILRACELGVDFHDLRPQKPHGAIRTVSHDPSLQATILLNDGRELTAIQLQRELLDRSYKAAKKAHYITQQEGYYYKLVHGFLNKLEADPHSDECKRLFDWVLKQELIDAYLSSERREKLSDHDAAWRVMRAYNAIFPHEGVGMKRLRGRKYAGSPSKKILEQGPPVPATRASLRAETRRRLGGTGLQVSITWDTISVSTPNNDGSDKQIGTVFLGDPYAIEDARLEALLVDALSYAA